MAPHCQQYTLVGFLEEVDRRPLFFTEPLSATKVCSACALVPNVIAFLPCGHSFCKPCYRQCERSGRVACPLGKDTCLDEEVAWINHPARSVLAKQVLCWNQANGCNVVTAASDLSKHFHHECQYHLVRCTKCGAEVLAGDVCPHLESYCDASAVSSADSVQPKQASSQEQEAISITCGEAANGLRRIADTNSKAISSIQGQLKEVSRAFRIAVSATLSDDGDADERKSKQRLLQESLSQIQTEIAKQKDHGSQQTCGSRFTGKRHALRTGVDEAAEIRIIVSKLAEDLAALRKEMGGRHRETKREFDRLSVAISSQCDRKSELLLDTIAMNKTPTQDSLQATEAQTDRLEENASKIAWAKGVSTLFGKDVLERFPSIMPVATTRMWTFKGYASLMERRPRKQLFSTAWYVLVHEILEPVYLCGYCISVGLGLDRQGDFKFCFKLHKGKIDEFLEWPFDLGMKLVIHHPYRWETRGFWTFSFSISRWEDRLSRPVNVSNDWIPIFTSPSMWTDLEVWGFIQNDEIRLSVTLDISDKEAP